MATNNARPERVKLGNWMKTRREELGLTQNDLAKLLNYEYYTYISAIESGKGRIPPEKYEAFAKALKMPALDLYKIILRHEDPYGFKIAYGKER